MFFRLSLIALVLSLSGIVAPAWADPGDKVFFDSVTGAWSGPGEIVAGKYKGTKFVCKFNGKPSKKHSIGVAMNGSCRVGVFSQKMTAFIGQQGDDYEGQFLNGADGKGLDVTSGRIDGNSIVMSINRNRLNGAMVAELQEPNVMNVTISVKVQEHLVPVIGMTLRRANRIGSAGDRNEREFSR